MRILSGVAWTKPKATVNFQIFCSVWKIQKKIQKNLFLTLLIDYNWLKCFFYWAKFTLYLIFIEYHQFLLSFVETDNENQISSMILLKTSVRVTTKNYDLESKPRQFFVFE